MRMEQRLTPQLIQSMAVLQKPVAELEAYVEQALESNAALEIDESQSAAPETPDEPLPPRSDREQDVEAGFRRLDRFSREFDSEWSPTDRGPPRRADWDDADPKMGAMANTAGREQGLTEHLLDQWALIELDADARRAGVAIINSLDADGYLRKPFAEIAAEIKPPVSDEVMNAALIEVQHLEPPGVGARTPVECLLLQLDALPGDNTIERTLIEHHLNDLAHNRLPAVVKATGFSMGEITEAIKAMRSRLYLHPGHLVGDRSVPPIRPDVIVEYADSGGGLTVRLARGNMPRLRVRDEIIALSKSKETPKEEREFAKKHVDEAAALIDAVQFRKARLLQVARAIAEKQRDFFDQGPAGLKVCRMNDLAAELECDPSTISRTVSEKYMQTPQGVLPMRYFFTGGTETEGGESIGWEKVRMRVRELVEAEDHKDPLNDDQIVALLTKEGIDISRRTVAKYRQQLSIPAARQRRVFE